MITKYAEHYSVQSFNFRELLYTILTIFQHDRGTNKCGYLISLPWYGRGSLSLIFKNLTIPPGEKLLVWKTTRLYLNVDGDPVKVFTHVNSGNLHYIGPDDVNALLLEFNSTTHFKISFQEYKRGKNNLYFRVFTRLSARFFECRIGRKQCYSYILSQTYSRCLKLPLKNFVSFISLWHYECMQLKENLTLQ